MNAVQRISSVRAKKILAKDNSVLLDVRSPVLFRNGSLPGAKNMTIRNVSSLFAYPKTTSLIIFGQNENDPDITVVVNYATQLGFTKIFVLGSIENW